MHSRSALDTKWGTSIVCSSHQVSAGVLPQPGRYSLGHTGITR
jgi:hypothetical protein